MSEDSPEVLFVCVHNAGRSQMAAGLVTLRSQGRIRVRSAGSAPAEEINPNAVAALEELGIDMAGEFPKPLTDDAVRAADVVITMGCGDACPIYPGKRYEDWELDDPAGQDLETVRRIRDEIDERVQALVAGLLDDTAMPENAGGSAARWGPLFGARAATWAETWEGTDGWGTRVYEHVLARAEIGSHSRVLDCGCGAGRFARMVADRGASVAGIDAAEQLIEIAAERVPEGDFRVGDIQSLPWEDGSFDLVVGLSAFQFADDKVRALTEAARVSRGVVAVVIPVRVPESGITFVFKPVFPLFADDALESMKNSGMFALSEPGMLDKTLAAAGLTSHEDDELEFPIVLEDVTAAKRAFLAAGPTQLAIGNSSEAAVTEAIHGALEPFTAGDGRVVLPAWYRVVICSST